MQHWGEAMSRLQTAMFINDFKGMAEASWAINRAPEVDKDSLARLEKALDSKEYRDLRRFERYLRETSENMAKKAGEKDIRGVLVEQGKVVAACVQCHDLFQVKILMTLK
ncbi:MAG: hypothetical protein A2527_13100 [Candidatus Lambdaproteobacteria bacterium RIFOXYD2_FULL_50_16]|uniref:Cytochrome C n=1 Tax=Candidatus Lambdaproteobacteria bacterium RIFOXYD2_FULL_50_16 TaxID=1817772 RepID=A0A1F6GG38_9PROT|nr:MAG: hypothetical protein A2527_13100 [Candidatus Lambdaproteobacteria bacterium RIFOXYD2_FULL_50_16]